MKKLIQISLLIFISGCTNALQPNQRFLGFNPTPTPSSSVTGDNLIISNVIATAPSSMSTTGPNPPSFTIYFDTAKSKGSIANNCSVATSGTASSKLCICQFSWSESNSNSSSRSPIPRVFQSGVTSVQNGAVSCSGPDFYYSEIPDGTSIKVTVVPGSSNSSLFSVSKYNFLKSSDKVSGSFTTSQGQIFDNIVHYSCYQRFQRGMSISSRAYTQTNSNSRQKSVTMIGTQFCLAFANNTNSTTPNSDTCPTAPTVDYSSQAYYFNMFIRNTEQGNINLSNSGFTCPTVYETLTNGNLNNGATTVLPVWPRDTTFALSISPTSVFKIGVVANTKLAIAGDPTSVSSSCGNVDLTTTTGTTTATSTSTSTSTDTGTSTSSTGTGFVQSCLGFAAAINTDGTCPFIQNNKNQLVPTYRLRRYVAIYPRVYDTGGYPLASMPQAIDTIYVLDRPVRGPTNSDPLKPYTMRGPKPCPFAFFDRKGVSGARGYLGTSNNAWSGKNIDGIEFPNVDSKAETGVSAASCSTSFPILDATASTFGITTVNLYNTSAASLQHMYVRPVQGFAPHFEEDTDFQACAPQAVPLQDAPLHFAKDPLTSNVGWCTEAYPSQNANITSIDPPISVGGPTPNPTPTSLYGTISPYTSHVVRNTTSNTCTASRINIPTTNYTYPTVAPPPASPARPAYARHSSLITWDGATAAETCDRTVVSKVKDWTLFPLLAPSADVESAIVKDSSFWCTMTYDNQGGKTDKSSPAGGCCSSSSVSINALPTPGPTAGHLEPDVACQAPTY